MCSKAASVLLGLAVVVMALHQVLAINFGCGCGTADLCKPAEKVITTQPQVYVFSRKTTAIHLWKWSTIDAVVVPPSFRKEYILDAETLCITHGQKKKFGITVDFNVTTDDDFPGSFKTNTSVFSAQSWVSSAILKEAEWHADIVTVNLIPYFLSDKTSDSVDHMFLAKQLVSLQKNLKEETELLCIVPWKPPCTKSDDTSCEFVSYLWDVCTYFVINSDSFLDNGGRKCTAGANIPLAKLVYGISEYGTHHVPASRIILGVSWHGYDYICSRLEVGSVRHQIWFEDQQSLTQKYRLVHELGLKGIAVLYGDDLYSSNFPNVLTNDEFMWTWLSHELLWTKAATKRPHSNLHWADTMAGVAVGCFLLGALLGVIFTCISMQKRIKKPRQPFHRDTDPLGDEYTDDPEL